MATIQSTIEEINKAREDLAEALITKFGVQAVDVVDSNGNITTKGLNTSSVASTESDTYSTPANTLRRLKDWEEIVNNAIVKTSRDLVIKLNSGSTENTNYFTYNGSEGKTVNITPSSIGAAASGHTHNYLPLSGGQLTGSLNFFTADAVIEWNTDSYRQRIKITDDSTANTSVFTFQQSSDGGSSYKDLFTIYDNGNVTASTFIGNLTGTATGNLTSISYDSTTKKLKQTKNGTTTEVVTFGSNAFNSTSYLPLSGGTMTGNITFSKPTEAGQLRGFVFNGVTDSAALYYIEPTLKDDGRMRFIMKDNANDPIEMAWCLWDGTKTLDAEVRHTFNYNGYTTSGTVIASSFKHPKGESTQFLKADGSVDNTTYLSKNDPKISNWDSAYNWFVEITKDDEETDTAINKWQEIESFLAGISDTSTLNGILGNYYIKTDIDDKLNNKSDSSHTHTLALTKEGTATITLAHNTTYTLQAGGKSIVFKTPSDNNTWVALKGASSSAAGTAGYTPQPKAGDQNKYLRGDAIWSQVSWNEIKDKPNTLAGYGITDFKVTYLPDSGENLNNITTPGFYNAGGSNSISNKPNNVAAFGLIVVHDAQGSYYTQILFDGNNSDQTYIRHCNNGTWGSWSLMYFTDTNTWRKISINGTSIESNPLNIKNGSNINIADDGSGNVTINSTVPTATSTALGGIKIGYSNTGKNYKVQLDTNGNAYVNVPWTNTNTTYSAGTGLTLNGTTFNHTAIISEGSFGLSKNTSGTSFSLPQIKYNSTGHITSVTNYTQSISIAGNNSLGLVRGFHCTSGGVSGTKTTSASDSPTVNNRSSTTGRYYGVETDKDGYMFVNVPWIDTNTWRDIQGNGTSIGTNILNIKPGTNIGVSTDASSGAITVAHTTGAGYNHIPAGGSSGQILRWKASGEATWGSDNNSNTIYAYCDTAATTAAKIITFTGYKSRTNNHFLLTLVNGNSYKGAITLNVNDTGAKTLYINGKVSSDANYSLNAGVYWVYYNGTYYYLRTDNYIQSNITGNADTVDGYHASNIYNASKINISNPNTTNSYIQIAKIVISGTTLSMAGFTAILSNREYFDNSSFILTLELRRNSTTSVGYSFYYTDLQLNDPRDLYVRSDDGQNFYVYFKSAANTWTTYYTLTPLKTEGSVTFSNTGLAESSLIEGKVLNKKAVKGGNVAKADSAISTTKLATSRTIWGQDFDGTANVSGSLSSVENINFSTNNTYSVGSSSTEAASTYTRQIYARHLNASAAYTSDKNLYIGYKGTANTYFYANTSVDGNSKNLTMTIAKSAVGIGTSSPAYLLDVAGKTRITGPLLINGGEQNYCEGIRIASNADGYATILLKGSDNTSDIGSSTNSWGIYNYNGEFYINKYFGTTSQAPRLWGHSNGWTIGKTGVSSYTLNVGGTIYSTGTIYSDYKSGTWVKSLTDSAISLNDSSGSYGGWICGPTKNGRIAISTYQGNDDCLYFGYGERGRTENSFKTKMYWDASNNTLYAATFSGNATSATKWTNDATIKIGNKSLSLNAGNTLSFSLSEIGVQNTWRDIQVNNTSIDTSALNLINSNTITFSNTEGKVTANVTGKVSTATTADKVANSFIVFNVSYNGSATKNVLNTDFIKTLTEATNTITDGTMLITSYASNNGFADTNALNVPYKRKASCLYNYIKGKTDSLYAAKDHTHSVKINGTTKTISKSGSDSVDLGNYLTWYGNANKSNMNDIARLGQSTGMTNLSTAENKTDNPYNGGTESVGWHLYFNTCYSDGGNGSNSWVAQIVNKAGADQWWVRSRKGATVTNGTAWDSTWRHLVTSNTNGVGNSTTPVYVDSYGQVISCSYSLNKTVPSDAKFTDTNTWRDIQINGTSINTNVLNLCPGTNVALSNNDGKVTISAIGVVTSLGTNGNNLTYTTSKGTTNVTVPYATSSNSANSAEYLSSNKKMEYGWNGLNYFNASLTKGAVVKANDSPSTAWWHILRFNHANSSGYYTDLAIPFNDTGIYYKRICAGVLKNNGWVSVIDSLNLASSFASTLSDVTIATGDKLIISDASNNKLAKTTSINFDGSTKTKALTQAGTWETFNNYTLPTASTTTIGGIKIYKDNSSYSVSANTSSIGTNITSGPYFGVEIDNADKAFTYVPWTNYLKDHGVHTETASATSTTNNANSTTEGMLFSSGMYMTRTYNETSKGMPTYYGNVLNLAGGGSSQLLLGWSGIDSTTARMYYRSHRDTNTGGWGAWKTVAWTDDIKAGAGINVTTTSSINTIVNSAPLYFVNGTNTAKSGAWTGDLPTNVTEYYNGLTIRYRLSAAPSGNATLQLGSLAACPVYINQSTRVNTHYPQGSILTLTYYGGFWYIANYDSSTWDTARMGNAHLYAGVTIYSHTLVGIGVDGKAYPITSQRQAKTDLIASATYDTNPRQFGILYNYTGGNKTAENALQTYCLYEQRQIDWRYVDNCVNATYNASTNTMGLQAGKPVYIKVAIEDGGWYPIAQTTTGVYNGTSTYTRCWTQTEFTKGSHYIYVGIAYNNHCIFFASQHKLYYAYDTNALTYDHDGKYLKLSGGTMTGDIILKGSTSNAMEYSDNIHPKIRFDNIDSSQNISILFTDYDSYRSPAGLKIIGNQGKEWLEVAGSTYANKFISSSTQNAITVGNNGNDNTNISALSGQLIINNGTSGTIRFGASGWDWNNWAGLKYVTSTKTIHLGLPDGNVFNYNSAAQTNGTLNLVNIKTLNIQNPFVITGGGLEITGVSSGASYATSEGFYTTEYNNLILRGDTTYGKSGILFTSSKGTTSINQTSDKGFIQFQPYGRTATSGESNKLVIGVGNDNDDMVCLQTPSITGLRHAVGTSTYVIPANGDNNNGLIYRNNNLISSRAPSYPTASANNTTVYSNYYVLKIRSKSTWDATNNKSAGAGYEYALSIYNPTDKSVLQSVTTTSNWRPILTGYSNKTADNDDFESCTQQVYWSNSLRYQPSEGILKTTKIWSNTGQFDSDLKVDGELTVDNLLTMNGGCSLTNGIADLTEGDYVKIKTLQLPTASNGTTYGPGTNGQVLKSNGTTVYWATDNNNDTKNTAGSTNSTSKLFLIGATSQANNPQTYSNQYCYVSNGTLYSGGVKVLTSETSLNIGGTNGGGNAITDISVSGHTINLTKGSTFLTSHQSLAGYLKGSLFNPNTAGTGSNIFQAGIAQVGVDGVMEVGKYIDFHYTGGNTYDYNIRLICPDMSNASNNYTIEFPQKNGTIALLSDLKTHVRDASGNFDFNNITDPWRTYEVYEGNNAPTTSTWNSVVDWGSGDDDYRIQLGTSYSEDSTLYIRHKVGGSWKDWKALGVEDDYIKITAKFSLSGDPKTDNSKSLTDSTTYAGNNTNDRYVLLPDSPFQYVQVVNDTNYINFNNKPPRWFLMLPNPLTCKYQTITIFVNPMKAFTENTTVTTDPVTAQNPSYYFGILCISSIGQGDIAAWDDVSPVKYLISMPNSVSSISTYGFNDFIYANNESSNAYRTDTTNRRDEVYECLTIPGLNDVPKYPKKIVAQADGSYWRIAYIESWEAMWMS